MTRGAIWLFWVKDRNNVPQCCANNFIFGNASLTSSFFVLKGFNSSETRIKTADGKVWKEEEFHNLSRDFYRDLTLQLAGKI